MRKKSGIQTEEFQMNTIFIDLTFKVKYIEEVTSFTIQPRFETHNAHITNTKKQKWQRSIKNREVDLKTEVAEDEISQKCEFKTTFLKYTMPYQD